MNVVFHSATERFGKNSDRGRERAPALAEGMWRQWGASPLRSQQSLNVSMRNGESQRASHHPQTRERWIGTVTHTQVS